MCCPLLWFESGCRLGGFVLVEWSNATIGAEELSTFSSYQMLITDNIGEATKLQ